MKKIRLKNFCIKNYKAIGFYTIFYKYDKIYI